MHDKTLIVDGRVGITGGRNMADEYFDYDRASTDNIQAFSGYRNQRRALLKMGLDIHEYKPDPANRATLVSRANDPETAGALPTNPTSTCRSPSAVRFGCGNCYP